MEMVGPAYEEFNQLFSETTQSPTTQRVDRKTIRRDCHVLEKQGLARYHQVNIEGISSASISRNIISLPDISSDSEEFQTFIKSLRHARITRNYRQPSLAVLDVDVDRLKVPETQSKHTPDTLKQHWAIAAVFYGYLIPKYLRVMEFHVYLMDFATKHDNVRFSIRMQDLVSSMPLSLYLAVIGMSERFPSLDKYLENRKSLQCKIIDLPFDIKPCLRRVRLRLKVILYLKILSALGLVDMYETSDFSNDQQWSVFQFSNDPNASRILPDICVLVSDPDRLYALLSNCRGLRAAHVKFLQPITTSNVRLFWEVLRDSCIKGLCMLENNKLYAASDGVLNDITSKTGWLPPKPLVKKSPYQRSGRNRNSLKVSSIGSSSFHQSATYVDAAMAMESDDELRQNRKRQEEKMNVIWHRSRLTIDLANKQGLFNVGDKIDKRQKWTKEDDDLLLLSAVICEQSWKMISILLPTNRRVTRDSLCNRWVYLHRKNIEFVKRVERLQHIWMSVQHRSKMLKPILKISIEQFKRELIHDIKLLANEESEFNPLVDDDLFSNGEDNPVELESQKITIPFIPLPCSLQELQQKYEIKSSSLPTQFSNILDHYVLLTANTTRLQKVLELEHIAGYGIVDCVNEINDPDIRNAERIILVSYIKMRILYLLVDRSVGIGKR